MGERALQVSSNRVQEVKIKFIAYGLTQEQFATRLGVSRKTISNFLNRKPVDRTLFIQICERLELNWKLVNEDSSKIALVQSSEINSNIDRLVQQVRSRCCEKIQSLYSKVQLLNLQQVPINQLYVDLYVLNKIPSRSYA